MLVHVPAKELHSALKACALAATPATTGASISNFWLELRTTGKMRVAATNGHWLAMYDFDVVPRAISKNMYMGLSMDGLKSLLQEVSKVLGPGHVAVDFNSCQILGSFLDRSPFIPAYEPLLERTGERVGVVGFSPEYLGDIVKCFKAAYGREKHALRFEMTGDSERTLITNVMNPNGPLTVILMPVRMDAPMSPAHVSPKEDRNSLEGRLTAFSRDALSGLDQIAGNVYATPVQKLDRAKSIMTDATILREILSGSMRRVDELSERVGQALKTAVGG